MMSERYVTASREIDVPMAWEDVWRDVPRLLDETLPTDVRWVHVERMKSYYESMLSKYEAHVRAKELDVSVEDYRHD